MKQLLSKKLAAFIISATLFSATTFAQWANSGTSIYNLNSGNVGIGTAIPNSKLEVASAGNTDLRISSSGAFGATRLSFISDKALTTEWRPGFMQSGDNGNFTGRLDFYTNGTSSLNKFGTIYAMSVTNGKLGIGTSNPLQKLHVYGASIIANNTGIDPDAVANTVIAGAVADGSGWALTSGIGGKGATVGSSWGMGTNNGGLFIGYGNGAADNTMQTGIQITPSRAVLIAGASGNVGIGNNSPSYKLDVSGNSYYTANMSNSGVSVDNTGVNGSCANTPFYGFGVKGSGGYMGVYGTATLSGTGSRFGVYGYAYGGANNYGVYGYAPTGAGNYAVYAAGNIFTTGTYSSSDAKLKKDVQSFESAMDKINRLQPRTYNFKTDEFKFMGLPSEKQYGFIAQELETVFPELVRNVTQPIDNDTKKGTFEFKAINYVELIPVLTQALKEQNHTIEELKADNAELKQRMDNIEAAIRSSAFGKSDKAATITTVSTAKLYQNSPNPFNENTVIRYNIPMTAKQATINVSSFDGKALKSFPINEKGTSQINISGNSFATGSYVYQLIVDGQTADTKTMILVK